jgi:hypothetical protein
MAQHREKPRNNRPARGGSSAGPPGAWTRLKWAEPSVITTSWKANTSGCFNRNGQSAVTS